jgi:hypothetical protein
MRTSASIMKTLAEREVANLWEWMLEQYPVADDPDRSRGGEVTTRHAVADFRDSLISYLADLGTEAGCDELRRLIANYPQFAWFRRVLLKGQDQLRRLTWQPTTPALLFQLAASNQARLVQSGGQLLAVITESLGRLEARLQGETPLATFLWNGSRPKREEDVSEWVKVHLEDDLKGRGIVLGREVQIHRFDRTDIHVTAVIKNDRSNVFETAKVIIELKGDWHPKLKTAMETQLVGRYLKDNDCRHGLYLVCWFDRVRRGNSTNSKNRDGLQRLLTAQAKALSNGEQTIRALVLDCSIALPVGKKGTKSKNHAPKSQVPKRPRR